MVWTLSILLLCLQAVTWTWANGPLFVLEGSQTSYAQFRQWHGGQNDTLAFEFSSKQKDALLLYSDNNQEREYVQVKLVNGNVMLRYILNYLVFTKFLIQNTLHFRYNWGRGGQVITLKVDAHQDWHSVLIVKNGAETTLVVDQRNKRTLRSNGFKKDNLKSKQYGPRKDSDSLAFGDLHSNGYVFVGGLPSWYSEKMDSVVLPTTLLEPRFRGAVRNLKYRDMRSSTHRIQDMMTYKVSILVLFSLLKGILEPFCAWLLVLK